MNMMVNKTEYTNQQVKEIKMLVEVHGADCHLTDNEGRNILHYLAAPRLTKTHNKDVTRQWNIINQLTELFLKNGVSVYDKDTDESTPVVFALSTMVEVKVEDQKTKQKNLKLVNLLLKKMKESLIQSEEVGKEQVENIITKIMEAFVGNIEISNVSEDLEVFRNIIELIKLLASDTRFIDKVGSADSRSGCLTIFELLCRTFTDKSRGLIGHDRDISTFCQIVELFIREFSPSFTVKSLDEKRKDFSVLLHASESVQKENNFCLLATLLKYTDNVDVTDELGRTPLTNMIYNQSVTYLETLIGRGADVNRLRVFRENNQERRKLPIEDGLETGEEEVISCLLRHGAVTNTLSITGSSLIHQAVSRCARNKTRSNLQIVKLILANTPDLLHLRDDNQMTPLHTAINSGEDDADQSLDLETYLLRAGADLTALDGERRTPLHYAFLSNQRSGESRPCDPIQIVSLLVEAGHRDIVLWSDVYGSTALHYAAAMGATVSSLLLIQKGQYTIHCTAL